MAGSATDQITVYYLGVILLHRITQTWSLGEINDRIQDGSLAQTLLRPYNFMFEIFAKDVGQKVNRLISVIPVVFILWMVIRPQINIDSRYLLLSLPAIFL